MENSKVFLVLRKILYSLVAITLIILIGMAEYSFNEKINFSLLYLIPISFIVLLTGRIEGFVFAAISALGFIYVDYHLKGWSVVSFTIINAAMRFGIFTSFILLINSLKNAYKKESVLARKDSLTGVANGRAFYEVVDHEIKKVSRDGGVITLAYMDIDNFKKVNDTLGHNAGDRLLKLVAHTLVTSVRSIDTVARLGGDEFALLFPGMDQQSAQRVISRMKEILDGQVSQNKWPISFSIGAVTFKELSLTVDEMIRIADEHMYAVKNNGKNSINYYIYPS